MLMPGRTAMSTMRAVHEEMASDHQGKEAIVRNSADSHVENEYRCQRGNQTQAENPSNRWNTRGAIGYRGMRFHFYSFESNALPGMSLNYLRSECERLLACFVIRRFADGFIRLV